MDGDFYHYTKQAIPGDMKGFTAPAAKEKEGHNKEEIFHER